MTDRDLETETIVRWDRTGESATFWTADASEARRWKALGYDVHADGRPRAGTVRSWSCRVPVEAVALLPIRGGEVQISRYLDAPTIAVKGPAAAKREKDARIS